MAEAAERGLVIYQSRDGQEIRLSFDTVRKYLVSGHPELVTDPEIMLYMGTCKSRGLNPFKKDCYLIKYTKDDPAATIVSIDYYRSRAKAQPDCVGWQCGVIVKTAPAKIEHREGSLLFDGEVLLGGWYRARPKGWEVDKEWTVGLKRYIKTTREGKVTRFWAEENQPEQIAKVAESQGLRRTWPDEFGKLYIKEEIVEGLPLGAMEEEPLKTPKAKTETGDGRQATEQADAKATGTEETEDGRPKGTRKRSAVGGPPSAVTPQDPKAEALKWIAEVSDAEFLEATKWLSATIKDKSQDDQLEICRAWTERKRKITSELEAGGKE